MDMNAKIKIHNKFEVTVFDKDSGEVKQTAYAENIVLNAMYDNIMSNKYTFNGIAFGTGAGTLSASRTTLFNYLNWKPMGATDCGTVEEIVNFPTVSRKRKITLQADEYTGYTITEVGVARGSGGKESSGTAYASLNTHALLDAPILVTATDIIVIEATVYYSFGTWNTGFYNGSVKWRPADSNDLVKYLLQRIEFPTTYFNVGNTPILSNATADGLLATSSSISLTSWTKDVANKKMTTPATRFITSAANGQIKTFGLGSSDTSGIFTAILPVPGVFENYAITGESIGTGDGATTGFNFKWDDIDALSKVYLNGVETTDYTLAKSLKTTYTSSFPVASSFIATSSDGLYVAALVNPGGALVAYKRETYSIFTSLTIDTVHGVTFPYGLSMSSNGDYICVTGSTGTRVAVYKRNGNIYNKLTTPPNVYIYSTASAFSSDGTYLAVSSYANSPYLRLYKHNEDNTFTQLTNPDTMPTAMTSKMTFSPDNNYLVVGLQSSPWVWIYKRSGDTFTKLDNPATMPTGIAGTVIFTSDGTYLIVHHDVSPYITIYKRNGDVFTKLDNPATLPSGTITADYLPYTGDKVTLTRGMGKELLFVAQPASPYILVYEHNGDSFIPINNYFNATPPSSITNVNVLPKNTNSGVTSLLTNIAASAYTVLEMPSQDHNIEFTTSPASGVVITADYTIDYIPKDANHVLDLSATIQWG